MLGTLDGLIYVGLARLVRFYLDHVERTGIGDESTVNGYYISISNHQENWFGVTFLIVAIFGAAAYPVHRFWSSSGKHPVVTWVFVGIAAMTAWNLYALGVSVWDKASSGQFVISEGITTLRNPLYGGLSLGLVLLVNAIYGTIVGLFVDKRH